MTETVDILACGAHPDDIEIGMGGTIAAYVAKGSRVAFLTLTKAELSSNGTVATRQEEAARAAAILGVHARYQLDFPDRGLRDIKNAQLSQIVKLVRVLQPQLVFYPHHDRHPDHGHCGQVMKEAVFNAAIRRFATAGISAHRVKASYAYFINGIPTPSFLTDVSAVYEQKKQALQAYESQFTPADGVSTPLTDAYIDTVIGRDRLLGKEAGVPFAEGFYSDRAPVVANLLEG
ncbi:bacillithiol biosynthesis deacetylase BshB1 [Bacillus sp. FSL W7-1360]